MDAHTFDRLARLLGMPGTRRAVFGALLGTAVLGTAVGSATAKAKTRGKRKRQRRRGVSAKRRTRQGNHCVSPSGVDLNEFFGISAQIVAQNPPEPPFLQGCDKVGAGERWTVAQQVWIMPQTFEAVPNEFEPAGETPLADFLAKFEGVKYVIDPGTRHQRTVFIPTSDALFVNDVEEGFDLVSPTTLGTLGPLRVGPHLVQAFWVFSGMHCDGLGTDPDLQCLRAGETLFNAVNFRVTPRHY
jgi:hypothetical protein